MQCIRPIQAGYDSAYKITFNFKNVNKELDTFCLPCGKCLPCRLNIARDKAVRVWHESKMHQDNIFLTLTYDEEHLYSNKLQYTDFQLFMKSLREKQSRGLITKEEKEQKKITYMVTGEYGEENKRPHWHAIIFNYRPEDAKYKYTTDHDEKVYTSESLSSIWKRGNLEFGSVTLDSASYVARYASKKLVHGKDQEHDYHPIHKTSSKKAIGRTWIEKNFEHTFSNGFIVLPNGQKSKIPRYYVDWLKKHQPKKWKHYVTQIAPKITDLAESNSRKEELEYFKTLVENNYNWRTRTRPQIKERILQSKFKKLQENLKL